MSETNKMEASDAAKDSKIEPFDPLVGGMFVAHPEHDLYVD